MADKIPPKELRRSALLLELMCQATLGMTVEECAEAFEMDISPEEWKRRKEKLEEEDKNGF